MARQVFFNPFGSYTEGFDQGAGRQIQAEGAKRQARSQDFDFNNFVPLRLAEAQRQDQLGRTLLPYQEGLAPYALLNAQGNFYDAQARRAADLARATTNVDPLEQLYSKYFNFTPATSSAPGSAPVTTLFTPDENGNLQPTATVPNLRQHILDYADWTRLLQARQLGDLENYRAAGLQNTADRNNAYQLQAQARWQEAMRKFYGANGGVTANSLFGTDAPDLTDPSFYTDPSAAGLSDFNLGTQ